MKEEIRRKLDIAFSMADKVNKLLAQELDYQESKFVSLDDILESVKELSKRDANISTVSSIDIIRRSFKSFPEWASDYGAMLGTQSDSGGNTRKATIVVNTDKPPVMQRFSTAHEIGHLITNSPNYETPDDNKFTISTHIRSDITFISEADLENNDYVIAEQRANIFALLVLIPRDIKIKDLTDIGVESLAKEYGVTEDAVYSRMLLSNVLRE